MIEKCPMCGWTPRTDRRIYHPYRALKSHMMAKHDVKLKISREEFMKVV